MVGLDENNVPRDNSDVKANAGRAYGQESERPVVSEEKLHQLKINCPQSLCKH